MIIIGELRHRVTFQESVSTPDGAGGFTQSWRDIATDPEVSAAITVLSASERQYYSRMQTAVTHKIYVRWRGDITAGMRAVKGDTVYNITSAFDRDGTKACLEILATVTA